MNTDDLMICTDCALFLANGEVEEPDEHWPGPDAIEARWPDRDIAIADDGEEFGWSAYDACGSDLGGARHAAVAITHA